MGGKANIPLSQPSPARVERALKRSTPGENPVLIVIFIPWLHGIKLAHRVN
jgi:hypothetical protein